ncbi:hypothetical protein ACFLZ1_01610 [Patescibacteria group bacterium]
MLTTPHVVVSLAILKIVPNPGAALVLAFLSHFVLDWFIPHWNPHLFTEHKKSGKISKNSLLIILTDGFLSFTLLLVLSLKVWPDLNRIFLYYLTAFAATLPDLIEIPYYFMNSKNKLLAKYVNFEHENQANGTVFWGILTQVIVVLAGLQELFS